MKKGTKNLPGSSRTGGGRRLRTSNATLAYFRRHWLFYAMLILPVLYYFLFCYRAMPGVVIAFKNYNMFTGIWDSPWVGMEFFKRVAQSDPFWRSVRNTLVLNILGLVVGFPLPIILALFLNEIMHTGFKKTVQTVLYLPHFISWAALAGIFIDILSPSGGIVNQLLSAVGLKPVFFLGDSAVFPYTMAVTDIWKELGWGTIVYLAAITGIDPTYYEAARMDGAGRFKLMRHITLPALMPTFFVLLMLSIANFLNNGMDQYFVFQNAFNKTHIQVLDLYVYNLGITGRSISLATAISMMKSVVSVSLLVVVNFVSKRVRGESII